MATCFWPICYEQGEVIRCSKNREPASIWCALHGLEILEERVRSETLNPIVLEEQNEQDIKEWIQSKNICRNKYR
jgi:hypothetical protein